MDRTTQEDIREWLREGKKEGATHVIVACDTFDWSDYPIYCAGPAECWKQYDAHDGKNMQKVMEVYDLSLDLNRQLNEIRAVHLPPKKKTRAAKRKVK